MPHEDLETGNIHGSLEGFLNFRMANFKLKMTTPLAKYSGENTRVLQRKESPSTRPFFVTS